jgi:hypothetical protein
MVEGGPRAGHEAEVALAHAAVVLPVGRSGGYAASLYARSSRPPGIDESTWTVLGSSASTPEQTARAALRAVLVCLGEAGEQMTQQAGQASEVSPYDEPCQG